MKVYQQILRGDRSCERGIRYRRLRPSEVDALRRKAAQLVAGLAIPSETQAEERRRVYLNEGIKTMLVAVTKAPVAKPEAGSEEPRLEDDALWQPLDVGTLTMPGPFSFDELFESPDADYLAGLFVYNHEAQLSAVDSILKKERTVSTG